MKKNNIALIALAALAVAGCEDKDRVSFDTATFNARNLHYTYPLDNQTQLAPRAIVALQFSHTVSASADNFNIHGCRWCGCTVYPGIRSRRPWRGTHPGGCPGTGH